MEDVIEITLTYNDINFTVQVDNETYNKLTNDKQYASQYAFEVYKALNKENTEVKESNFKWTQNLIKLLIDIRLRDEPKFNRPISKKKQLWQNIAKEMNDIDNSGVTGEMCDIKYRNLLGTYRVNKKKQNSTGESSISWEYFEIFDAVLGYKASSAPSTSMLGSNLEEPQDNLSTFQIQLSNSTDSEFENLIEKDKSIDINNSIKNDKHNKVKHVQKRKLFSIENYLMEKLEKDRQVQDKKIKLAEEKENTKKEMFTEKMRLKEKEIEAMLELAKALRKE